MELDEIICDAQDQDGGRDFELRDPVDGTKTGIILRVAGPDSLTQNRAQLRFVDELAEAADDKGRVMAVDRERARLYMLAGCVLGWQITEDGKPVPFNQANVVRLLRSAAWVRTQVDVFAADRAIYRG